MANNNVFVKDPQAVLDYVFDWAALTHTRTGANSDYLAVGETISSFTVTAQSGLVVDSSTQSGGAVTAWLSGGTDGTSYTVTCHIVTSAGRTDERTIIVRVANL